MKQNSAADEAWYENFFHGVALDLWRKAVTPEQTGLEADFLERALRLRSGARVLDVPCGVGRHALALASRGYCVTGVDLSAEAISEARECATAAALDVNWRQGDMRDLPWESEFEGGFCFGNSFGYLDPQGTRAFVRAVSRALQPAARFALDSGMAAESVLPNLREREWAQVDDILFLEENRYDAERSCVETTYTFVQNGQTHRQTGLHWVYTVREIRDLLEEAGLVTQHIYGGFDGAAFRVGSPHLLVVAEKQR